MTNYVPDRLCDEIRQYLRLGRVDLMEPMTRHTTLELGGPADVLAQPGSREEDQILSSAAIHHAAKQHG